MSEKCAVCELNKPFKLWTKKQKIGLAITAASLVLFLFLLDSNGPLMKWARSVDREQQIEQIGAQMSDLAAQGKPDAIVWMAVNHPDVPERLKALEALAESGNGEAMMTLAAIKHRSDPYLAKVLVNKAAAAGHPDAVLAVVRQPDTYKL
ncbi:TPA: hypothetical protein MXR76_005897 [Pseudomonas aeruginosa]|nr:hypothetical protein [Pseudomonas aeruginosa]HCA5868346.1 hypothetical protein [Pseudomonas aeruginosa]HCA7378882.1 hypothetical protein [Pseudomonas aeruginosa]HCA7776925.1 hypothetical protein [Pseudomonas aeruginosa]